ncbi:MAG: hypothetical protein KIPDCIKN_04313 [Haliscomenobacter sp.]|nr:hypothetical protein [Haliscomenobacter sp.]
MLFLKNQLILPCFAGPVKPAFFYPDLKEHLSLRYDKWGNPTRETGAADRQLGPGASSARLRNDGFETRRYGDAHRNARGAAFCRKARIRPAESPPGGKKKGRNWYTTSGLKSKTKPQLRSLR